MLKQTPLLLFILLLFNSCIESEDKEGTGPNAWKDRNAEQVSDQGLEAGSTFLSIYTQIYIRDDKDRYDLTATVSIHNPNAQDRIYIDKSVFYNTEGEAIRSYFSHPVFIRPMETIQIIIPILDNEGGTGANFIFDWRKKPNLYEPLFEAVMVSSQGSHGISFVTVGKRLK